MRMILRTIPGLALCAAVAAGCTRDAAEESARRGDSLPETGSYYSREEGGDSLQVEGTATGDMLTAPAIIGPMELQLAQMRADPERWLEANATSQKFLLADLVNAMENDLNRLGVSDNQDLQALGDSASSMLGGGTGPADALSADEVPEHADRVERLIALYRSKLQQAGVAIPHAPDSARR